MQRGPAMGTYAREISPAPPTAADRKLDGRSYHRFHFSWFQDNPTALLRDLLRDMHTSKELGPHTIRPTFSEPLPIRRLENGSFEMTIVLHGSQKDWDSFRKARRMCDELVSRAWRLSNTSRSAMRIFAKIKSGIPRIGRQARNIEFIKECNSCWEIKSSPLALDAANQWRIKPASYLFLGGTKQDRESVATSLARDLRGPPRSTTRLACSTGRSSQNGWAFEIVMEDTDRLSLRKARRSVDTWLYGHLITNDRPWVARRPNKHDEGSHKVIYDRQKVNPQHQSRSRRSGLPSPPEGIHDLHYRGLQKPIPPQPRTFSTLLRYHFSGGSDRDREVLDSNVYRALRELRPDGWKTECANPDQLGRWILRIQSDSSVSDILLSSVKRILPRCARYPSFPWESVGQTMRDISEYEDMFRLKTVQERSSFDKGQMQSQASQNGRSNVLPNTGRQWSPQPGRGYRESKPVLSYLFLGDSIEGTHKRGVRKHVQEALQQDCPNGVKSDLPEAFETDMTNGWCLRIYLAGSHRVNLSSIDAVIKARVTSYVTGQSYTWAKVEPEEKEKDHFEAIYELQTSNRPANVKVSFQNGSDSRRQSLTQSRPPSATSGKVLPELRNLRNLFQTANPADAQQFLKAAAAQASAMGGERQDKSPRPTGRSVTPRH